MIDKNELFKVKPYRSLFEIYLFSKCKIMNLHVITVVSFPSFKSSTEPLVLFQLFNIHYTSIICKGNMKILHWQRSLNHLTNLFNSSNLTSRSILSKLTIYYIHSFLIYPSFFRIIVFHSDYN